MNDKRAWNSGAIPRTYYAMRLVDECWLNNEEGRNGIRVAGGYGHAAKRAAWACCRSKSAEYIETDADGRYIYQCSNGHRFWLRRRKS